jgi:hypothetical protein
MSVIQCLQYGGPYVRCEEGELCCAQFSTSLSLVYVLLYLLLSLSHLITTSQQSSSLASLLEPISFGELRMLYGVIHSEESSK